MTGRLTRDLEPGDVVLTFDYPGGVKRAGRATPPVRPRKVVALPVENPDAVPEQRRFTVVFSDGTRVPASASSTRWLLAGWSGGA